MDLGVLGKVILRGFTFIGPQINLNQKLALTYLVNCFLKNEDIIIEDYSLSSRLLRVDTQRCRKSHH